MPTTTATDDRQAIPNVPPLNWQNETPRYRVVHPVRPSPNPRHRTEPPPAYCSDNSIWTYADRDYAANEVVETKLWPHAGFQPLNFIAQQILRFFQSAPKSRLALTPFDPRGRLRLDGGFGGPVEPHVVPPKLKPMDLRPVRFDQAS